jgi:hypothetical protein
LCLAPGCAARVVGASCCPAVVSEWDGPPDVDAALDFYGELVELVQGRIKQASGAADLNRVFGQVLAGLLSTLRKRPPGPRRPRSSRGDSTVEKWRRWIEENISPDVHMTYLQRAAYRRVQEIVEGNPGLPRDSYFWEYLQDTYAVTQAAAVRRQTEVSVRVRSLGQLIAEIEADTDKLTRDFFVDMWRDPGDRDEIRRKLTEYTANGVFDDKFAGTVGDHLDPAIPRADLADLTGAAASVKAFVDESIAHSDKRPSSPLPTFAELDAALDLIGELLSKYTLLLTAAGLVDVVPTIQTDWEAVFRQPWIPRAGAKR